MKRHRNARGRLTPSAIAFYDNQTSCWRFGATRGVLTSASMISWFHGFLKIGPLMRFGRTMCPAPALPLWRHRLPPMVPILRSLRRLRNESLCFNLCTALRCIFALRTALRSFRPTAWCRFCLLSAFRPTAFCFLLCAFGTTAGFPRDKFTLSRSSCHDCPKAWSKLPIVLFARL